MAVIDRAAAVADIFILHMYIVEFQSRVQVFIQWGFKCLTFSRGARPITGSAVDDSLDQSATIHFFNRNQ